jgi:DNA helicase-2/ATP-dependent DNA helicase PcrA
MLDVYCYESEARWYVVVEGDIRVFPNRSEAFAAARTVVRERVPSRLVSSPPGAAGDDASDPAETLPFDDGLFDDTSESSDDEAASLDWNPSAPRSRARGAPPTDAPSRSATTRSTPARSAGSRSGAVSKPAAPAPRRLVERAATDAAEWVDRAGPPALGRSLLIDAGGRVPAPWANAERIVVDSARWTALEFLDVVREAYVHRLPRVYEVVALPPEPEAPSDPVWALPVDFEIAAEAAWLLVAANAVDARATESETDPIPSRGDERRSDGRWTLVDGGPLRWWSDDELAGTDPRDADRYSVVPAIAWEHGARAPLTNPPADSVLAPDQRAAVVAVEARTRVIAPAGSGKTRVLTERARHIVRAGIPPAAVCLVAFNKRAQTELQERLSDVPGLMVQTLNALALGILNGRAPFARRRDTVRTIDEMDVRRLLGDMVKFPRRANTDPAAAWIDALAAVRLGLRSPAAVELEFGGDVDGFAEFFPAYEDALRDRGVVDFDDQIYGAIEALLSEPETRRAAQRACRVLLVDEFQDLTPAHVLLLRLLAAPALEVFGVGDDDQTIYGYSGASPDWLIEFDRYVPGAQHHALEVNYRCPSAVVTAVDHLLSRNQRRVAKVMRAGPVAVAEPGALVRVVDRDPVAATARRVTELIDAGSDPGDIAVLARVNTLLVPVQVALGEAGIPIAHRAGFGFLERTGVAAALSWLRIARTDGLSGADVQRAARRPGRSLSPRVVEWMGEQRDLDGLRRLAGRLSKAADTEKVNGFVADVERIRTLPDDTATDRLLEFVRTEIGLDRALETLDAAHRGRNTAAHSDDLRALIALGRLQPDPTKFGGWLRRALERPPTDDGVELATVHRVKGLEWPHVIVHDATLDVFPHVLSTDREEERRVFHVALTRGRVSVALVAETGRVSPFLAELDAPATVEEIAASPAVEPRSSARSRGSGSASGSSASGTAGDTPVKPGDEGLVDALKQWRLGRARSDSVPAYVVLTDKSLKEIAARRPTTSRALLAINGIGPAKLERYGDEILALVDDAGDPAGASA